MYPVQQLQSQPASVCQVKNALSDWSFKGRGMSGPDQNAHSMSWQPNHDIGYCNWIWNQARTQRAQLDCAANVKRRAIELHYSGRWAREWQQRIARGPDFIQQDIVLSGEIDHCHQSLRATRGHYDFLYYRISSQPAGGSELPPVHHVSEIFFPIY